MKKEVLLTGFGDARKTAAAPFGPPVRIAKRGVLFSFLIGGEPGVNKG
jgi:hypothetical protein